MTQREGQRKFSTRLIRKGALLEETHRIFVNWDASASFDENLDRARSLNTPAAGNEGWLKEIIATVSSRWRGDPFLAAIVALARRSSFDVWRACVLWHIGRQDELYYRFAAELLFPEYIDGTYRLRTDDVVPFVDQLVRQHRSQPLSSYGTRRAARDLLRMAANFGFVRGRPVREFAQFHIPEESFLYLLHALMDLHGSTQEVIQSTDWRLFLMGPAEVELEIYRLHQYRKLQYEVAGSLAALTLPYPNALSYVEEMDR